MNDAISAFELALQACSDEESSIDSYRQARHKLVVGLSMLAQADLAKASTLEDCVDAAMRGTGDKRASALMLLRAAATKSLLPATNNEPHLHRKIVALSIAALPDVCKQIDVNDKNQNHENFQRLTGYFVEVESRLIQANCLSGDPQVLLASRNNLMKSISSSFMRPALSIFDGDQFKNRLDAIFGLLEATLFVRDYTFRQILTDLKKQIEEARLYADARPCLYTKTLVLPLLANLGAAATTIEEEAKGRFASRIEFASLRGRELEKRYPLHEASREINILVPLENVGPGPALNVSIFAFSDSDAIAFNGDTIALGDVDPGRFSFTISALVLEPAESFTIQLEIKWHRADTAIIETLEAEVIVRSQGSTVQWSEVASQDPYSTEVARGSEFFGRKEKLAVLVNRLSKGRMESSYITGQKRVGKSSLALAVKDALERLDGVIEYKVQYLEWGEIACGSVDDTVEAIGHIIFSFLADHLDKDTSVNNLNFKGSIAQLNIPLGILQRRSANIRFIVIIDEFDSMPPELYRLTAIADVFFSNIRSLAAKPNFAFILVGGEKMPLIMAAQGDELNKFVKEEVSYFDRTSEWDDFASLIALPTVNILTWHQSALSEIYKLTSGHPYFAKLLCKEIFNQAVRDRDCDITADEVRRAYDRVTSTLGENAFAHIWRDGIKGTREEEEVVVLRRCRMLAAIGRALRGREELTISNIDKNKQGTEPRADEILPILNEFRRRGFVSESGGVYRINLPIFHDWLCQAGTDLLLSDTAAEEIEDAMRARQSVAFIRAEEIRSIVESWGSYCGRRIGTDEVRAWLEQVGDNVSQRMLLKLLNSLRFLRETEIIEKLRVAHMILQSVLQPFVRRKNSDRRSDIVVTYVDGPAKSGAEYARLYAEVNFISSKAVLEISEFSARLEDYEREASTNVSGVVIVDDFVGTGRSFSGNLATFFSRNRTAMMRRSAHVSAFALVATQEGTDAVQQTCDGLAYDRLHFRSVEVLSPRHYAFAETPGIWESKEEYLAARELCKEKGLLVSKKAPLGFGDQGLLLVFPRTVPNNTLAIIHSGETGANGWRPLFRRPTN